MRRRFPDLAHEEQCVREPAVDQARSRVRRSRTTVCRAGSDASVQQVAVSPARSDIRLPDRVPGRLPGLVTAR
ncbi:hypothetical protein GCM10010285_47890 [Streptomyces pseudogriseolus]|uniref:Uncharacterized protein n=1 Tax=Streptomyces pseudogriseolus TaxID=36817 RepID=A0ABQ2TEU8_STREZ|nr:hypothetical protein GCM10010285_47890 [Streptomyces rubiginosus]